MSKKYLSTIIFIIVALIIVVIITLISSSGGAPASPTTSVGSETTNPNTPSTLSIPRNPTTPVTQNSATPNTSTVTSQTYTLADVAKHNNKTSCWTVVNGGVYNVTSWISQHPGGEQAIISMCGIDGSDAFNGQHGGQRRPANELASFKIGTLAQ